MLIYLVYLLIDSHYVHGYNYGLGYIASVLKQHGYRVKYIPIWREENLKKFYSDIYHEKPSLVAFSATSSQFPYLKDISKRVKSISEAFLLCGGTHTTLKPNSIETIPDIDAIAIGEGEYATLELANALSNNKDYLSIQSLWFQTLSGIKKNSVRPLTENLNLLPFPDKESVDYQSILDKSNGNNRFIFSRGCTFKCSYCSNHALSQVYPNKNKYYRYITPQRAIEQIQHDHEKYNFKFITFDDDTISLNKKWFFEFFDLYKKNFQYPFRCNLRIETVNEDVIKTLKEANAQNIGIGLEHGNYEFRRDELNRKMSDEQIKKVFDLCHKYDLTHDDFIMVGFPSETRKLFFDTVKLSRKVGSKGQPSIFQPYPATKLAEVCEKNNWLPEKEIFKERVEAVIDFPNFSKEDIQLCADVFKYLNKNKFLPLIDNKYYLRLVRLISKTEERLLRFQRRSFRFAKLVIQTICS